MNSASKDDSICVVCFEFRLTSMITSIYTQNFSQRNIAIQTMNFYPLIR